MQAATETPTRPGGARQTETDARRRVSPVAGWAALGALVLTFEAVVLIRWVSGPYYFARVKPGPTRPPGWMKPVMDLWQIAGLLGAAFCLYWFVLRPWRRERRLTVDGLLVLAFATLWFQD